MTLTANLAAKTVLIIAILCLSSGPAWTQSEPAQEPAQIDPAESVVADPTDKASEDPSMAATGEVPEISSAPASEDASLDPPAPASEDTQVDPSMTASEAPEAPSEVEDTSGALSPEIMVSEPPLSEKDFDLFIELYNFIISGASRQDFKSFADANNVTLRRLNYITAKITMPLGDPTRKEQRVNELGLGVLMNADERALFLMYQPALEELSENMRQTLGR
jgi:hypothetical protein